MTVLDKQKNERQQLYFFKFEKIRVFFVLKEEFFIETIIFLQD